MLLTVIIVCISNGVFSQTYNEYTVTRDDLVDNIFHVGPWITDCFSQSNLTCNQVERSYFHNQNIQNIGKADVEITAGHYSSIVEPLKTKSLPQLFASCLNIKCMSLSESAIVYSSVYRLIHVPNIEDLRKDQNEINVMKKTVTIGVKMIPKDDLNLKTLISYFWPEKEDDNIWMQLFKVVKAFSNVSIKNKVSKFIKNDIDDIKKDMVALTEINVTDITDMYFNIDKKFRFFDELMDFSRLDNFYFFPLYTNMIKLHMYVSAMGSANPEIYQHRNTFDLREVANRRFYRACKQIRDIQKDAINKIYNKFYAPGLFNVLMNAYNYVAFHGLQLFSVWEEQSLGSFDYTLIVCTEPIVYSNLYGKATPNLLEQAIHINISPLAANCKENGGKAAKLNSIVFYIRTENELKTVYGLSLRFSSNFHTSMGTTETSEIIDRQKLSFANSTIIKLKVYRTVFIRCLEFTWANGTSITVGDNCGNVFGVFQLKDHYINSLYLANDYPDTEEYFDNIAVSFLPNSL